MKEIKQHRPHHEPHEPQLPAKGDEDGSRAERLRPTGDETCQRADGVAGPQALPADAPRAFDQIEHGRVFQMGDAGGPANRPHRPLLEVSVHAPAKHCGECHLNRSKQT